MSESQNVKWQALKKLLKCQMAVTLKGG